MTTTPTASPELLDLDKLEALARAATAGPWLHRRDPGNPIGAQHCVKLAGENGAWVCDCIDNADRSTVGGIAGERNAAFIAAANPEQVLALIGLARRAKPEGEAPQALSQAAEKWAYEFVLQQGGPLTRSNLWQKVLDAAEARFAPAATLSPLCGAQPAESGKENGSLGSLIVEMEAAGATGWAYRLTQTIAAQQAAAPDALDEQMRRLRAAFHINMLRAYPSKSHDEIAAEIGKAIAAASSAPGTPVQMILHCPACGVQHIDAPDERTEAWDNPPHRSHLCHGCGHIWRPADVATEGVAAIQTRGSKDLPAPAPSAPGTPEAPADDLYDKAVMLVRARGRASTSLVQRTFLIGYNRASRLLDAMEKAGVILPSDENGHRTVIAAQLDGGQEGSESNG